MDTLIACLDLGFFEVTEAFRDLRDEHVWVRPAPGLLSIGELAGHVAYWEAIRFAGELPDGSADRDLSNCKIKSDLLDPMFRYYTTNIVQTPKATHLNMTAAQVEKELLRIHAASMACLRDLNPDLSTKAPQWGGDYLSLLQYLIFHVSYHTGQMYSVRHLLGDTTPDN
jgi:hypothetical protein